MKHHCRSKNGVLQLADHSVGSSEHGAAMVEYVIILMVVTIIAMKAMHEVGKPMVQFYLLARGLIIYPV